MRIQAFLIVFDVRLHRNPCTVGGSLSKSHILAPQRGTLPQFDAAPVTCAGWMQFPRFSFVQPLISLSSGGNRTSHCSWMMYVKMDSGHIRTVMVDIVLRHLLRSSHGQIPTLQTNVPNYPPDLFNFASYDPHLESTSIWDIHSTIKHCHNST